jgi:hypothetical protein
MHAQNKEKHNETTANLMQNQPKLGAIKQSGTS